MDKPTVTTDHKWKNFKYHHEVPAKVLAEDLSWTTENEDDYFDGFFRYRRRWYHISEFMTWTSGSTPFKGWDGYSGDSCFSAVLIKLSKDGEQYQVGTYIS